MTFRSARLLLLALLLPLAACDEAAPLASSPDLAIDDATTARDNGDLDGAVRILETSLASNPQNAPLRVELASTLLQRADLDLLDLDRIARFLSEGVGAATATSPASTSRSGDCAFASDPAAVAFDPTAIEDYPELQASRSEAERAVSLTEGLIPASLRPGSSDAAFCGSIDYTQSPPVFNYDAAAAEAELRAQGLSETQIGQVLADYALARFSLAYLDVTENLQQQTTWYRLADGSIGICADDAEALEEEARTAIADVLESLFALDLRASTFVAGSAARDILGAVTDTFEDVRDGFGDYCDVL